MIGDWTKTAAQEAVLNRVRETRFTEQLMNQSLSYFNSLQSNSRSKESITSPIQTSSGPKIKSLSFSRNLALYGTMGSQME